MHVRKQSQNKHKHMPTAEENSIRAQPLSCEYYFYSFVGSVGGHEPPNVQPVQVTAQRASSKYYPKLHLIDPTVIDVFACVSLRCTKIRRASANACTCDMNNSKLILKCFVSIVLHCFLLGPELIISISVDSVWQDIMIYCQWQTGLVLFCCFIAYRHATTCWQDTYTHTHTRDCKWTTYECHSIKMFCIHFIAIQLPPNTI